MKNQKNNVAQASSLSFIRVRPFILTLLIFAITAICTNRSFAMSADEILKETGIQGGLVVHLGCGDGKLTSALYANKSYIVHGLDSNSANIAKAREYIKEKGIYGKVSVEHWDKSYLPYASNFINLLISDKPNNISKDEILRILAPLGVAYIKNNGKWEKTIKPWSKEIDEWTHWLHGADGNAVAKDKRVGSPSRLQWLGTQIWDRNHHWIPSITAMVSSKGRLFFIGNEAKPVIAGLPDRWYIIAYDAFNGIPLWKKPILNWGTNAWSTGEIGGNEGRYNSPIHIARRLVAVDDKVYITLGFNACVSALDAATGKLIKKYEGTEFTEEILHLGDKLILSINKKAQIPGSRKKHIPIKKNIIAININDGKILLMCQIL